MNVCRTSYFLLSDGGYVSKFTVQGVLKTGFTNAAALGPVLKKASENDSEIGKMRLFMQKLGSFRLLCLVPVAEFEVL